MGATLSLRTPAPQGEDTLPTQGGKGVPDQQGKPPAPVSFLDITVEDMASFFDIVEDTDSEYDSAESQGETPINTIMPQAPEDTPLPEVEEFESDPDMPPLESFSENEEEPQPKAQQPIPNPYQEENQSSQYLYDPQEELEAEGPESEFLRTFNLSYEEPGTSPAYKVIRHINTTRKMVDWSLVVRKKWLFLRDSNLAKFPPYNKENLQIDSFPGANFRNTTEVIGKASVHLTVKKIILSFGINSRKQKTKETTIRQVQGAIRAAKKKFPLAEILIPLVNFSRQPPEKEQDNLREVNSHIERNMPFLPRLNEDRFETTSDLIHWTNDTAVAMFNHWSNI